MKHLHKKLFTKRQLAEILAAPVLRDFNNTFGDGVIERIMMSNNALLIREARKLGIFKITPFHNDTFMVTYDLFPEKAEILPLDYIKKFNDERI